jgi:FMN phosphatase YigB (HAD superfamily)
MRPVGTRSIDTVFVDVGGTLLPNAFPLTPELQDGRLVALQTVLSTGHRTAAGVMSTVDSELASAPERTADEVIASVLGARGFAPDAGLVRSARQGMCVPLPGTVSPFDYAGELLSKIRELSLGCVIVSNTTFRDAEMYRRDFQGFGWDEWVDGYVTSVDACCSKPDERIFRLALEMAGTRPDRCVMIGNSEQADIEPALRFGMRAIRVAIEEPVPAVTAAGVCVTELAQVPDVLQMWAHPGFVG